MSSRKVCPWASLSSEVFKVNKQHQQAEQIWYLFSRSEGNTAVVVAPND